MEQFRTCIDCKQTKPLTDFLIDKSKKTGYKSRCLLCGRTKAGFQGDQNAPRLKRFEKPLTKAEAAARWARNNPERRNEINAAFRERNRLRQAEKMRAYRKANPDSYKKWARNNPEKVNANWNRRRGRLTEAGIFFITKKEMTRLYSSPCVYCGARENIHADHVIPIARGGRHSIGNLVPACAKCNMSKSAKTITEWKNRK